MDDNDQEKNVREQFDPLLPRIKRVFFELELRITIDHLLNHTGAKLVSQQGREIDVHPETVKHYHESCSLAYDYITAYWPSSDAQAVKALRDKWTTPAKVAYFKRD